MLVSFKSLSRDFPIRIFFNQLIIYSDRSLSSKHSILELNCSTCGKASLLSILAEILNMLQTSQINLSEEPLHACETSQLL